MRRIAAVFSAIILVFAIASCDSTEPTTPDTNGKLAVSSTPAGAAIYLDGTNTNKTTPDTVSAVEGIHQIKLTKTGYADTTFQISFIAGQTGVVSVVMSGFGELAVTSEPAGAVIWLDNANSGYTTPHTFSNLSIGNHTVSLVLADYVDTTFTANIEAGLTFNADIILEPVILVYGTVTLWETIGTTAEQPSGLDLSSGMAYGISSADKIFVDIYYTSNGFLVQSAHLHDSMTRETYFKVGGGTDLTDGVNSGAKDASWGTSIADTESHYVFLYDQDGNYSKLKIVEIGGGTPGNPAWVKVEWHYNTAQGSVVF